MRMGYGTSGVRRVGAVSGLVAAAMLILTAAHPGQHAPSTDNGAGVPVAAQVDTSPAGTVAAFHVALTRGDTAGALALLAEDVRIFESGVVERNRAEYAAHHLQADAAFSAAVRRTQIDQSSGEDGDTAWVMTVETVAGTYRTRAISSRSVETMILRRRDGNWRIFHIHWSSADI